MAAGGFVVGGGGLLVGGGGLDVGAAGFIVGLTGTMGFSVSVLGTGGQTRFSNLTERDSELVSEVGEVGLESGSAALPFFWSLDSHIFLREEMDPVLFLLSSSASGESFAWPTPFLLLAPLPSPSITVNPGLSPETLRRRALKFS